MSRIGRKPIIFSNETTVNLNNNKLTIENKERKTIIDIPNFLTIDIKENNILLSKSYETKNKHVKSMFGTKRQEINNVVLGFEQGFKSTLKLYGVGYNLVVKEDIIVFSLGLSHTIEYKKNIDIQYEMVNKDTLNIYGTDKQLFGEEINKIKRLRKRNVYDCYGIYDSKEERIKKAKRKK